LYGGESDAEKGRAGRSRPKTSTPQNVAPKTNIVEEESRSRSTSPDQDKKASKFNFKFGKSGNR